MRLCGLQQGKVAFVVTKYSAALKDSKGKLETTMTALQDSGEEVLIPLLPKMATYAPHFVPHSFFASLARALHGCLVP